MEHSYEASKQLQPMTPAPKSLLSTPQLLLQQSGGQEDVSLSFGWFTASF